jgi:hypothetical protein
MTAQRLRAEFEPREGVEEYRRFLDVIRYEIAIRGEFSRDFDLAFPAGVSANAGYVRVWNESNDDWFDARENRLFASASLLW